METGLKVILGLAGLGVAYAVIASRRAPTLPGGSTSPQMPPASPRPSGGAADPLRPSAIHGVTSDDASGTFAGAVGDILRMQGAFPSGFDVDATPFGTVTQLARNDFKFTGPGVATISWTKGGVPRTVVYNIT